MFKHDSLRKVLGMAFVATSLFASISTAQAGFVGKLVNSLKAQTVNDNASSIAVNCPDLGDVALRPNGSGQSGIPLNWTSTIPSNVNAYRVSVFAAGATTPLRSLTALGNQNVRGFVIADVDGTSTTRDLVPNTTYEFMVQPAIRTVTGSKTTTVLSSGSFCEGANRGSFRVIDNSAVTVAAPTCSILGNLIQDSTKDNRVNLSWTAGAPTLGTAPAMYEVTVKSTTGTSPVQIRRLLTNGAETTRFVGGLTANPTFYIYSVRGIAPGGFPFTAPCTGTFTAVAPSAVIPPVAGGSIPPLECITNSSFEVDTTKNNRIRVSWKPYPQVTAGVDNVYTIKLEDGGTQETINYQPIQGIKETSLTSQFLGGLTVGRRYRYTVGLKNATNVPTCTVTFTAVAPVAAPANPRASTTVVDGTGASVVLSSTAGNIASGDLDSDGIIEAGERHADSVANSSTIQITGESVIAGQSLGAISVGSLIVVSSNGSTDASGAEIRTVTDIRENIITVDIPFVTAHTRAALSTLKKQYPVGAPFKVLQAYQIAVTDILMVGNNSCTVSSNSGGNPNLSTSNMITCTPALTAPVDVGTTVTEPLRP